MSLLDDPALRLPADTSARAAAAASPRQRVRFRAGSRYAADFRIPVGATAEVLARRADGEREVLYLRVEGVGFCTGVPGGEVV